MSDPHDLEPWWGDESPVGTDRHRPPADPDLAAEPAAPYRNGVDHARPDPDRADRSGNGAGNGAGGQAPSRAHDGYAAGFPDPGPVGRDPVGIPDPGPLRPGSGFPDPGPAEFPDPGPIGPGSGFPDPAGYPDPDPVRRGSGFPDPDPAGFRDPGSAGFAAADPRVPDPGAAGPSRGVPDPGIHGPLAPEVGGHEPGPAAPRAEPTRSSAQVFIPAPEDLPPFEEVVDPIYPGPATAAAFPDPVADLSLIPDAEPLGGVPPAPSLVAGGDLPPAGLDVPPPAPDLSRQGGVRDLLSPTRPRQQPVDRRRLAVVYDVDGPRVRLGLAWFVVAMAATMAGPFTAAVVFAVAAGFAARQVVRAWGSVSWQADVAAGLGAVPVVAAVGGTTAVVGAVGLALVVAVGAACAPDGSRLPGGGGRLAAAGILALSIVPAVGGAMFVLVRAESVVAATVLLLLASAYEVGDYIVGSGASNPIEGPLAGITTATLVSLPLALVLVEPYDAAGVALLGFAALACPLGQVVASAVLPGAGAYAPALRRIDTLLVLAPLWAAAAGAF